MKVSNHSTEGPKRPILSSVPLKKRKQKTKLAKISSNDSITKITTSNKSPNSSYELLLKNLGVKVGLEDFPIPNENTPSQFSSLKDIFIPEIHTTLYTDKNTKGIKGMNSTLNNPLKNEVLQSSLLNIRNFYDKGAKLHIESTEINTEGNSRDCFETFTYELDSNEAQLLIKNIRSKHLCEDQNTNRSKDSETIEEIELHNSLIVSTGEFYQQPTINSQMPNSSNLQPINKTMKPPGFAPYNYSSFCTSTHNRLEKLLQQEIPLINSMTQVFDSNQYPFLAPQIISNLETKRDQEVSNLISNLSMKADNKLEYYSFDSFFYYINSYLDVQYCLQDHSSSKILRTICSLHIANHICKVRTKLLKNNDVLKSHNETAKENKISFEFGDLQDRLKDQGFTRPRVLILSPFRSIAKEFVDQITNYLSSGSSAISNQKRFDSEFGIDSQEKERLLKDFKKQRKPEDFQELFSGNHDDKFIIGVRVSRKTITLYSPLYSSDIILASPLGLKLAIQLENKNARDFDFLSSIEILVADRLDISKIQNWKNIEEIWEVLNLQPKRYMDFDIRRVRNWNIQGHSACYRQTILLSYGNEPHFNALFNQSANFRGAIKLWVPSNGDALKFTTRLGIKQIFLKVPCKDPSNINDALINFFEQKTLQKIREIPSNYLIVLPSYLEYLRLEEFLKNNYVEFYSCHEYSSDKELSFSRQKFFHSLPDKGSILLTTERFLFYRRYLLRGADSIVFVGPPYYKEIYQELNKTLNSFDNGYTVCLYTQFHIDNLENLVGLANLTKLIENRESKAVLFK